MSPCARGTFRASSVVVPLGHVLPFHCNNEISGAGSPAGDRLNNMRDRYVHSMHAILRQNIDSSTESRGYRGDENREKPVLKFFDNERGDESIFNFGQRRLRRFALCLASQLLSKTSNNRCSQGVFGIESSPFAPRPLALSECEL
jgi:hypothetical protein